MSELTLKNLIDMDRDTLIKTFKENNNLIPLVGLSKKAYLELSVFEVFLVYKDFENYKGNVLLCSDVKNLPYALPFLYLLSAISNTMPSLDNTTTIYEHKNEYYKFNNKGLYIQKEVGISIFSNMYVDLLKGFNITKKNKLYISSPVLEFKDLGNVELIEMDGYLMIACSYVPYQKELFLYFPGENRYKIVKLYRYILSASKSYYKNIY